MSSHRLSIVAQPLWRQVLFCHQHHCNSISRRMKCSERETPSSGEYADTDSAAIQSARVLVAHNNLCSKLSNSHSFTPLPEVPSYCCMSGCPNCVYLEYALEMAEHLGDNGASALKVIDAIENETLKGFLQMEIKMLFPDLKSK